MYLSTITLATFCLALYACGGYLATAATLSWTVAHLTFVHRQTLSIVVRSMLRVALTRYGYRKTLVGVVYGLYVLAQCAFWVVRVYAGRYVKQKPAALGLGPHRHRTHVCVLELPVQHLTCTCTWNCTCITPNFHCVCQPADSWPWCSAAA